MARRFRSEIKLARKVRHRNVCRIHEYGEDGGLRYIAMEYIDGVDLQASVLRQRGAAAARGGLRDRRSRSPRACRPSTTAGIIHRDLKTPNIMLRRRRASCGSWTSASPSRPTGGRRASPPPALIMGTPEYMSPEQAAGRRSTSASDIYALGIVIFEIFPGRCPFRGDTPVATLLKQMNEEPPLVSAPAAGLPPQLRRVLREGAGQEPRGALRHGAGDGGSAARHPQPGAARRDADAAGAAHPGRGAGGRGQLETDRMRTPVPTPAPTPVPAATPAGHAGAGLCRLRRRGPGSTAPPRPGPRSGEPAPRRGRNTWSTCRRSRPPHVVNARPPVPPTPMPSPTPVRTGRGPRAGPGGRRAPGRRSAAGQRLVLAWAGRWARWCHRRS